MKLRAWMVASTALLLSACAAVDTQDHEEGSPPSVPNHEVQTEGTSLQAMFEAAALEFDVPVPLMKAIAWVETRGQMVVGMEEFPGRPAAFGLMALRGEQLEAGASHADVDVEDAKYDPEANIRAAAAVLSAHATARSIDRASLAEWAEVAVAYAGIESLGARVHYVHDQVYATMQQGVSTEILTIEPREVVANYVLMDEVPQAGLDYSPAIWRPSPNYSSRPSGSAGDPQMVIIHSCEGSYAGCWSWLSNGQSGVSAHYVVKENGSELTQLVREHKKAWHIAAKYMCYRNGDTHCELDGYSSNNFTIGIEHAGYANQSSWDPDLLHASAALSCDISKAQNIARDKYHIVGHGQLQPYNRIDPGPNWPWSQYIELVNDYCGSSAPPPLPPPVEEDPIPSDPPPGSPFELVVDSNNSLNGANAACEVSSGWTGSSNVGGYFNTGYWWRSTGASSDVARFKAYLPEAAMVTIDVWWPAASDRSKSAPFIVYDGDDVQLDIVYVDQQSGGGQWVELGTYALTEGWNTVALSRWTTPGYVVVADAVRFRELP